MSQAPENPSQPDELVPTARSTARTTLLAASIYVIAILIAFGDVLLGGGRLVLSDAGADLANQFVSWRQFAFHENLAHGHLPLWNPHLYGGTPFLAGAQSALLYPVNWVHLLLPMSVALNVEIAINVFIAAMSMFSWTRHRRLHPAGCIFAGLVYIFSGPYWLHLYAGHLPHIAVMAWAPLVFVAIDGVIEFAPGDSSRRRLRYIALGIFAVSMQVLAGHPQYVYYTALVAAVYLALNLVRSPAPLRAFGLAMLIPVGAALLTAIQLLPSFAAFRESLRAHLTPELAGSFSLPPANLATAIAPGLFGTMTEQSPYWGQWYLWEVSLFVGAVASSLAIFGAITAPKSLRRFAITMTLVALVLAMGANTPLFAVLYRVLPGFGSFRVPAKFGYLAVMFACMLVAIGFDRLLALPRARATTVFGLAIGAAAAALLIAGVTLNHSATEPDGGAFGRAVARIDWSAAPYRFKAFDLSPAFYRGAAADAGVSLMWAGGTLALLAALVVAARRNRAIAYGVVLLGAVELLAFARTFRATFELAHITDLTRSIDQLLQARVGDARVTSFSPNLILSTHGHDVWGNDPMVLRRYAEFFAATQGVAPESLLTILDFKPSPVWTMLRAGYRLRYEDGGPQLESLNLPLLPHAKLFGEAVVIPGADERLGKLGDASFNSQDTVVLESPPDLAPQPQGALGTARVTPVSSDAMDVDLDTPAPAILLITDNYAAGWRAEGLGDSAGRAYRIVPANHTQMGIAVPVGRQRLRLEYRPAAFVAGAWVSGISAALVLIGRGAVLVRGSRGRFRRSRE